MSNVYVFFLFLIYRVAWLLIAPLAVLRLFLNNSSAKGGRGILERFGIYSQDKAFISGSFSLRETVWIHAVSVGETRAAAPLIAKLLDERSHLRIVLTHMTSTGLATGKALFGKHGDRLVSCYLPYDIAWSQRFFFHFFKPTIGLLMETEVWPTLTVTCRSVGLPLFLINARLSGRSLRRMQYFRRFFQAIYSNLEGCFAQSESDATRFKLLGLSAVRVFGNLKFDAISSEILINRGETWRKSFMDRPVWLAASTKEGEESLILEAHRRLLLRMPRALLLLVPRHTCRCDRVVELSNRFFKTVRRSEFLLCADLYQSANHIRDLCVLPEGVAVCVGDSMGEIVAYTAASDLAFVGGSLVSTGGQNLIECCSVGKVVLFGPSMFNFQQVSEDALAFNAAFQVKDVSDLVEKIYLLFSNKEKRSSMESAALQYAKRYKGATARTFNALSAYLEKNSTASSFIKKRR